MGVWGGIKKEKQLLNKLKAIDCVGEILKAPDLLAINSESRKKALRDICLYYKKEQKLIAYLKYSLQLMLA
jgi:predicted MarR family transcription regulator